MSENTDQPYSPPRERSRSRDRNDYYEDDNHRNRDDDRHDAPPIDEDDDGGNFNLYITNLSFQV